MATGFCCWSDCNCDCLGFGYLFDLFGENPLMERERWKKINREGDGLTPEEIAEGWHFCYEWDQLLVGPGMPEMECCLCFSKSKTS
jgi:hypothetical protein